MSSISLTMCRCMNMLQPSHSCTAVSASAAFTCVCIDMLITYLSVSLATLCSREPLKGLITRLRDQELQQQVTDAEDQMPADNHTNKRMGHQETNTVNTDNYMQNVQYSKLFQVEKL